MTRKYNFDLPYTIPYFYVGPGISQLQAEGVYDKVPESIRERLENAQWGGVEITEDDCNEIDDVTWTAIAEKLGLEWEPK